MVAASAKAFALVIVGRNRAASSDVAMLAFSHGKSIGEADSRSKKYFCNPLTRAILFGRIENCSARQSAYRAGGGETSQAEDKPLA